MKAFLLRIILSKEERMHLDGALGMALREFVIMGVSNNDERVSQLRRIRELITIYR